MSNLTLGMVLGTGGTVYRPCLRAKGAESRGLVHVARDQLRIHVGRLNTAQARSLLAACEHLCSFYDIMERVSASYLLRLLGFEDARHQPQHVVQGFWGGGGTLAPKHHIWLHLVEQFERHGNMQFSSTYPDETLNGSFAKVARSAPPAHAAIMCTKKYSALCDCRRQPL